MAVGWLDDGAEQSLRAAIAECAPQLADPPFGINLCHARSNPLWWSSTALVNERFVVKFAWSEVRATRLWPEGPSWIGWTQRRLPLTFRTWWSCAAIRRSW